jgi:hypothetical protein
MLLSDSRVYSVMMLKQMMPVYVLWILKIKKEKEVLQFCQRILLSNGMVLKLISWTHQVTLTSGVKLNVC